MHKNTVYRMGDGLFADECRKVAADYPDVEFEEVIVDTCALKLVMAPQQFDVLVTTNLYGDILSDRPAADAEAPTAWRLEGAKLIHKHDHDEVDAFKVAFLSLTRLRYLGERGLEIECRRP